MRYREHESQGDRNFQCSVDHPFSSTQHGARLPGCSKNYVLNE